MGLGGLDKSAPAQNVSPLPVKMTQVMSLSLGSLAGWVARAISWNIREREWTTFVSKQFCLE